MVLRTREELKDGLNVDHSSALSPEFSVNPRQTEFTDNTWGEEIGSVFRVENDITSFMVDESLGVDNTPDDNFNVFDEIKGTEYQDNAEYFMDAYNQPMFEALKLKLKREQNDRMMMERGGWSSMGMSFVAAVLSPTSLIPGSLAARSAKLGYSTSKSALTVGASGLAATSLQEVALQSSQGLRTMEESLLNVGMGTMFSAGIGAGLAGLSNRGLKSALARKLDMAGRYSTEFAEKLKTAKGDDPSIMLEADAVIKKGQLDEVKAMAELSDELKAKIADETDDGIMKRMNELLPEAKAIGREQNSVGAAAYGPSMDDLEIYGAAGSKMHSATKWFNPVNRTAASPSIHVRKLAGNLFESPVLTKMNEYADSPAALESLLKLWTEARLPEIIRKMGTAQKDGIFREMREAGINMTPSEYREQIARAMRRNDGNIMRDGVDTGEPSGEFNPFIVKAAKVAREELFERARKELNEVGYELASKKSKTADSYLTRLWSRKKLIDGEAQFKDRAGPVWNYVKNAIDSQIASTTKKFEQEVTNLRSEIDELKLDALRRESAINERVGPTIEGEYNKLNDIQNKIESLEKELEDPAQFPDEFGQVFENIAARILPEDVRVQVFDQIGRNGEPSKDFSPTTKEAAEKLVDDIADGEIAARSNFAKQRELEGLKKSKRQIEQTIDRLESGAEIPHDVGLQDVQAMLDIVRGGRDKPKKPQTLTQFIKSRGGLIDDRGELKSMGATPKTRKGFVKPAAESLKSRDMFGKGESNASSLDDAGLAAWEEGFFNERPTISELLDAIGRDFDGDHVVRQADIDEYSLYNDVLAVEDELARLGIDPKKPRANFARSAVEGDAVQAAARVMNKQAEMRIKKLEEKINQAEMKFNEQSFKHDLDPEGHVDEIVSSIFNKLTNRQYDDMPDDMNMIDFGYLKGRTFGIKDELIENFLENDIELIMRSYIRNVAGQIEMKKRFGNIHLNDHFAAIAEEYDALREALNSDTKLTEAQKEKQRKKLTNKEASDIKDLKFARDKLLGTYEHDVDVSNWSRAVDMALQLQYMAALGGVLLSSSLDVFRHPMTQGFGRIFGKALPQLIAGNKTIKLNRELAKKWAGIAEIINNSRTLHMAGLNDPSGARAPAEVAVRKMVEVFSKLTGLPYWNQFHKEFVGAVLIDRILENMVKGLDNISPAERRWMHNIGLGDIATAGQRMLADGTIEKLQGVYTIDPEKLPRAVSDRFFAAVSKEIDTTIVSKGMGDAPLFTNTPMGSMVGQFKSFGAASNQRMLIRGMQDETGKFVGGLTGMVTSGMFVYALKTLEAGRELDDNPGTWVAEGLDRSGMFFLFFEANNIWEKMGGYGAYQAIGARAPASRFATRNAVGAVMGPVFGSVNDLVSVFGNGARLLNPNAEFDPTPGDVKSLRRVTPYASLPYWRWLVDGYIVPHMQDEVR